jgi:hypothetical protein
VGVTDWDSDRAHQERVEAQKESLAA